MKVQAIFTVELPLRFCIGDDFKKTLLTQFRFSIDDIHFELVKNLDKNTIEKVIIRLNSDYDDIFLPSYTHIEYLSQFQRTITYKASSTLQKFLDGFSKHKNTNNYYRVFDGEDFTTPYKVEVRPNIMSGNSNGNSKRGCSYLDDEKLNASITFATKDKDLIDNAWFLLREAEHLTEIGNYELALINMSIMIEFLVTSKLTDFINDNGYFRSSYSDELEKRYGKRPSFVERYFLYGLSLLGNQGPSDELLETIDYIYKIRDKLAHGKQLYTIKLIRDNEITPYNIGEIWNNLLIDINEIYYFFRDFDS